MCLHKARKYFNTSVFDLNKLSLPSPNVSSCLSPGAVFTGYYLSNAPGTFFSMPVLLALLWALLKAGMVSDVFAVLNVSVSYKIVVSVRLCFYGDARPIPP